MASDTQDFLKDLSSLQASGSLWQVIDRLADGVHEGSVLLKYLDSMGKEEWDGGGDFITWNINDQSRTPQEYFDSSTLNTDQHEFLKPMSLIRAFMTMNVTYAKTSLKINKGNQRKLVKYVAKQIDVARAGFGEHVELAILGDGTTAANVRVFDNEHCIQGLQKAVETTPAASSTVYGGQTRTATSYYLNNQSLSITNLASLTTSDLKKMMQMCTHQGKSPNLIPMGDTAYRKVFNLAKGEQWYRPSQRATDLGFPENIKFGNADIVPLKTMTSTSYGGLLSADLDRIWFLNIGDGIRWYVDPDENMTMGPPLQPTNQKIVVQYIDWNGQLVCENPRLNGVIYW